MLVKGGPGDDILTGSTGDDTMIGFAGNDRYYVDNAGDQVIEAVGQGTDTVYTTVDYTLAAGEEVESLRVYGVATGLTLTGNEFGNFLLGGAGDDTLNGGGGNDQLDGGAGADVMAGGAGDDRYYVDNAGDRVVEAAGGGTDTVYSTVDYSLAAGEEIESLRVYGVATGLTLTGNEFGNLLLGGAGDDTLNGGGGNDRLDGGAGADVMTGGTGDDIYYVDNAGDRVIEAAGGGTDTVYSTVNYTLAAGEEIESLRAYGASNGLTLGGNEFGNYLLGGAGNDTLNGGGGNDRFDGGAGNDRLTGGAGNDRLDGGAGADMMTGADGSDSYYVDDPGDRVIEAANGGYDTIYTSIDYSLAASPQVEALKAYGTTAGLTLSGNELNNYLLGGAGDDVITGGGGTDTIDGGAGADIMGDAQSPSVNDVFYVDNAGDQIVGQAIACFVYSSIDWTAGDNMHSVYIHALGPTGVHLTASDDFNNQLYGGAGDDILTGGSKGNVLDGGAGADIMEGGAASDTYFVDNAGDQVFDAPVASHVVSENNDTINASADYTLAPGQQIENMRAYGTVGLHLTGNEFGMWIGGNTGDDTLTGGAGDDALFGNAGNDTLAGGAGHDVLIGWKGDDTFVFNTALGPQNVDDIQDFESGNDTIELDRTVFAGFALGQLSAAGFSSGPATGPGPQILYDRTAGALSYDSDGAGAAAAVQFATLTYVTLPDKAVLSAADFRIV